MRQEPKKMRGRDEGVKVFVQPVHESCVDNSARNFGLLAKGAATSRRPSRLRLVAAQYGRGRA